MLFQLNSLFLGWKILNGLFGIFYKLFTPPPYQKNKPVGLDRDQFRNIIIIMGWGQSLISFVLFRHPNCQQRPDDRPNEGGG